MRAVGRITFAGALVILFGGAFFTPQLATREDAAPKRASSPVNSSAEVLHAGDPNPDDGDGDSNDAFTDLYGNEVNDALATYTFDQAGSLYELHSPQTELPRLGSPKS